MYVEGLMELPEKFRTRSNSAGKRISSDLFKVNSPRSTNTVSPLAQPPAIITTMGSSDPAILPQRSPSVAIEGDILKDISALDRYKRLGRYNSRRESLPVGLESNPGLPATSSCSSLISLVGLFDRNSNVIHRPGQGKSCDHEFISENSTQSNETNSDEKSRHSSGKTAETVTDRFKSEYQHRRGSLDITSLYPARDHDPAKSYQENIMKKYMSHDIARLENIQDNEVMKNFSPKQVSPDKQRSFFTSSLIGTAVLLKSASDKMTSTFMTSSTISGERQRDSSSTSTVANQKSARMSQREMNAWSPTSM